MRKHWTEHFYERCESNPLSIEQIMQEKTNKRKKTLRLLALFSRGIQVRKRRRAPNPAPMEHAKWLCALEQETVMRWQTYRHLPHVQSGLFAGTPRIVLLAMHMIRHESVTASSIIEQCKAACRVQELELSELFAVADAVRVAVFFELLQVAKEESNADATQKMINILREIKTLTGDGVIKEVSLVNAVWMQDTMFAACDDDTKNWYLKRIASLALRARCEEVVAARCVRGLCRGQSGLRRHIGYYLYGDGQKTLCDALGIKYKPQNKTVVLKAYLAGITFVSVCGAALLACAAIAASGGILEILACVFFGFLLIYSALQDVGGQIIAAAVPPEFLPKLLFHALPPSCKTVVVVPVTVGDAAEVNTHMQTLLSHANAFREAAAYILLCDFTETDTKEAHGDDAILETGRSLAAAFNVQYGARFVFAVRERELMKRETKWMAYDRRHGALLELNRALMGQESKIVCYGAAMPQNVQYVIMLDSGAKAPVGEMKRLVSTIAHALNRAKGYGILQPCIVTPSDGEQSRIARLYAAAQEDCCAQTRAAVSMDVAGKGSFTGNGLYDVQLFMETVAGKVMEGTVLDASFLEGCFCKTAFVDDIRFTKAFSPNYTSWVHQEHRLVRGDWQLLPYLFGAAKDAHGRRVRFPFVDRWNMLDNLRRSLVGLAVTQLFFLGATFGSLPQAVYFLVAFLPYWFGSAFALFAALIKRVRRNGAAKRAMETAVKHTRRQAASFLLCAYETDIVIDAAVRGIWRSVVSKKKRMEWITKSQAAKGDARTIFGYIREMTIPLLFDIVAVVVTVFVAPERLFWTAAVCVCWAGAPWYARYLDGGGNKQSRGKR